MACSACTAEGEMSQSSRNLGRGALFGFTASLSACLPVVPAPAADPPPEPPPREPAHTAISPVGPFFCEKEHKPSLHCEDFRSASALPTGWTSTAPLELVEPSERAAIPDPTVEGGTQEVAVRALRAPSPDGELSATDEVVEIVVPWATEPPFVLEFVASVGTAMDPFQYLEVETGNVNIRIGNTGGLGKVSASSGGQELAMVRNPNTYALYSLQCLNDFCTLLVNREQFGRGSTLKLPEPVRGGPSIVFRTGKSMRNGALAGVRLSRM